MSDFIYLASQSPRRSQLLDQIGVVHKLLLAGPDEDAESLEDVRGAEAPALVVATGGPSIPQMGATGIAYDIARRFGLKVVEPPLSPDVPGKPPIEELRSRARAEFQNLDTNRDGYLSAKELAAPPQ